MKLFYTTDKIIDVVYDKDLFSWQNTINVPYSVLEIDEIDPTNKDLCIDLVRHGGTDRKDKDGKNKYYIENAELHTVPDWVEVYPKL